MAGINIGDVIAGKYRVEGVVGRGGMGVVVAARHLQLRERVAIKFPTATLSNRSDIAARLVREGHAAMRIQSEHVARVYDVGLLPNGGPYLVMQYLVGRDLGEVVAKQGPLPVADAVGYVLQALEALAEAHARGIIHRDLKPSNLFLTAHTDGSPLIKVIDFGLSKAAQFDSDGALTASDAVMGSRPYMPPEQMRSSSGIDVRSDIWAIGATLHTLLTGSPPFLAGSLIDIYERIQRGPIALRSLRLDAPAELEAILQRCMMVDPAQRYPSVVELAAALGALGPARALASAQRTSRIFQLISRTSVEEQAAEAEHEPVVSLGPLPVPSSEARTQASVPPSWHGADDRSATMADGTATLSTPMSRGARTIRPRSLLPYAAAISAVALAAVAFRASRVAERIAKPTAAGPLSNPSLSAAAASIVLSPPAASSAQSTPVRATSEATNLPPLPLTGGSSAGRVPTETRTSPPAQSAAPPPSRSSVKVARARRLKAAAPELGAPPPAVSWFDPKNPYVR